MRLSALPFLALTLTAACATTRPPSLPATLRIEVLPALDRVPITSADAMLPAGTGDEVEAGRLTTMQALSADLANTLAARGAEVCLGDRSLTADGRPEPARLAAIGLADGVEVVILPELIAYGQIRKSWLWLLAAQGLAAGIGHGVVVARATGNPTTGWWVGAGEFALETITWVGGALVASRVIDPVIVRVWAVDAGDGELVGRWTRENTRPVREWLRTEGQPPRAERLRRVADLVFARVAPKLLAAVAADVRPRQRQPGSGSTAEEVPHE